MTTTTTKSREERVKEFFLAAGNVPFNPNYPDKTNTSIWATLDEEVNELFEAMDFYVDACELYKQGTVDFDYLIKCRKDLVKELADSQYVLSQAAVYFETNLEEAFTRVHDNNMTKVVDGEVVRREDGKILKPAGYQPVDMGGL